MTIHVISAGLDFMIYVYVPNSKPVVHFPLVDLGWWVTILWMVGGHPHFIFTLTSSRFGWWVTILGMVADHP